MTKENFWNLIEKSKQESGDNDQMQLEILRRELLKLTPGEITAFDSIIDELMALSYRNDLWAAAYIINGGCSDDGFDYFRAWLIAQGQTVFESALQDPATLEDAIVMDSAWDAELEGFLYLPREVYEELTGSEMPERSRPSRILTGPDWDEEDVDKLFPKLAEKAEARFGQPE